MKDPIITYRGVSCPMSELDAERVDQLEQQQGTRSVQYRGCQMEADLHAPHETHQVEVQYRGAKAVVEL